MFHRHQPPVRLRRPVRGGMLHQFHAKMNRLPAHLTSEDDWKQDQPGVRLSRVFGVVLGIHVIAIGGLMAYEMFRHREHPAGTTTALRPAVREARPVAGAGARPDRVVDTFADDPIHDGLVKHVVAPGERPSDIAARFAVDEKALLVKNRIGEGRAFQSGMKLVIPNRQLVGTPPAAPERLLAPAHPASAPEVGASPVASAPVETPAPDGLVPVTPRAFDPSLPRRRAEAVAEAAPAKRTAPATAKTTPRPATKVAPVVAAAPKKAAASPAKKTATAGAKKPDSVAAKPKAKGRVHVVKQGENAYRIAKAYGVNLDQLIKTNGIDPSTLRPGTTLSIPPSR